MPIFHYALRQKSVLWLLLIINGFGTVYGYYWYRLQLEVTPSYFRIFVPDSPTASLFFCFVLAAFLLKRNIPLIEALAVTSMVKYGVWAVGMNMAAGFMGYHLVFGNYMLIFSHACMALEGILFASLYKIKPWHLAVAAVWIFHDVIIDYVFDTMPWYPPLAEYKDIIGYLTFWLSVITVIFVYFLCVRKTPDRK